MLRVDLFRKAPAFFDVDSGDRCDRTSHIPSTLLTEIVKKMNSAKGDECII
jgi:hypothetical protein